MDEIERSIAEALKKLMKEGYGGDIKSVVERAIADVIKEEGNYVMPQGVMHQGRMEARVEEKLKKRHYATYGGHRNDALGFLVRRMVEKVCAEGEIRRESTPNYSSDSYYSESSSPKESKRTSHRPAYKEPLSAMEIRRRNNALGGTFPGGNFDIG